MRIARGLIRKKRKWTDLIRCIMLKHSSKEPDQIPTALSSVFFPGVVRNHSMLFSFIPLIPLLGLFQAEDMCFLLCRYMALDSFTWGDLSIDTACLLVPT